MEQLGLILIAIGIVLLAVNATVTSVIALHWLGIALAILGGGAFLIGLLDRRLPPPQPPQSK